MPGLRVVLRNGHCNVNSVERTKVLKELVEYIIGPRKERKKRREAEEKD